MGMWIRGGSYSWGKYHYYIDENITKVEDGVPDQYGRTKFTESTDGRSLCNRRSVIHGSFTMRDGLINSSYGIRFVKTLNLMGSEKTVCSSCLKKYLDKIEPSLKSQYISTKKELDDTREKLETLLNNTVITSV